MNKQKHFNQIQNTITFSLGLLNILTIFRRIFCKSLPYIGQNNEFLNYCIKEKKGGREKHLTPPKD